MTTQPLRRLRARDAAAVLGATAIIALSLAGCASPTVSGGGSGPGGSGAGGAGPGGSSTTSPISGAWQLVSGSDAKGTITPAAAIVTLTVDGAKSGGNGGCNAFGARVSAATTGPLTITVGIHTEMACAKPAANATEARYFAALGRITTASIAGGKLTLNGGGDTLRFVRSTK